MQRRNFGLNLRRTVIAAALTVAPTTILISPASAGGGTGIDATSPSTQSFGDCTAQFVRSASDIINETNRNCTDGYNDFSTLDVWLQFRPQTNPTGGVVPNRACSEPTVVPMFPYSNTVPAISGNVSSGYFIDGVTYNVCVYYVHSYATNLSVSPNPVIQGHDVVFTSQLLVDGVASATPPATISVYAYGTDSTCTSPAGYGPFPTTQSGTNYTTAPLNASATPGTYYYEAKAEFGNPMVTRWSACTPLVISPHSYTLTLQADGQSSLDQVGIGQHVIYTGTAMDGTYAVSSTSVLFNVWAGTGCSGGMLYPGVSGATTDGSGNYTFDGGPSPAGVYSVESYTASATSNCVTIDVGATTAVNDVTGVTSDWDCVTGATGGNPTSSTVYWFRNQVTNTITVQITVMGAATNSTFDVWVEQNPGTCPPGTSNPSNPAALTTDGSGNGTASFSFIPAVGATNFWLSMWTPPDGAILIGTQVLRSVAATI
jgi:hypothetical protein